MLFTLAACATTSDIVPIGHGSYEVSGRSAFAWDSGGEQKIRLIEQANTFCQSVRKQAVVVDATSKDGHMGNFSSFQAQSNSQNEGGVVGVGRHSIYAGGWQGNSSSSASGLATTAGVQATADLVFRCE